MHTDKDTADLAFGSPHARRRPLRNDGRRSLLVAPPAFGGRRGGDAIREIRTAWERRAARISRIVPPPCRAKRGTTSSVQRPSTPLRPPCSPRIGEGSSAYTSSPRSSGEASHA